MYYKQDIFNHKLCPTQRQMAAMEEAVQYMSERKQARFERFKMAVAKYWQLYPWLMTMTILLTLVSCAQTQYVAPNDTITKTNTKTKTIERDSIYVHDSVFVKQYTKADTVYRDQWHISYKDRWLIRKDTVAQHDTITITKTKTITEQVRVVPKFYKWCTGLFFLLILGFIAKIVIKIIL